MNVLTVLPVLSLIAGIALSLSFGFPLFLGMVFAILVTLVSVNRLGYSWRELFAFGWDGVKQTKPVLLILFLVGLLIPLLMMGGTIPAIIYYGLSVVDVRCLLVLSFLLTAATSFLLGTSVGTLSTIGLSLMGIAHTAGVPGGIVGGALISGAMVGERFSPISSSRLLVLSSVSMTEEEERRTNRPALFTVGACALLFLLIDLLRSQTGEAGTIGYYQELLRRFFSVGWLPLVPLIVLIGSFALRVRAIPALLFGIAAAAALVLATSPLDTGTIVRSVLSGYELHSGTPLDQLVHGGGMASILNVLVLISLAGFLNGILNKANLLAPLVDRLMGETKRPAVFAGKAVLLSLLVVAISCNQTIPLLVLGSTLLERFSRLEAGKVLLGRTMLDSTLVMPVLIPWNGLAMVMAVTLGVSTVETLPYLFFPLLLPIVTIVTARSFQTAGVFVKTK
jgi:Na+:H+ antiporter, NhaC family